MARLQPSDRPAGPGGPGAAWRAVWQRVLAREQPYLRVAEFGPVDRIGMVREGLPARLLTTLADDMQVSRERLCGWLGIARATANRRIKDDELLSQDESERALGMARLIGQVQRLVAQSGEPAGFNAARWTADWLDEPNAALGGLAPGSFLDTADGRVLVAGLVAQMQSGAYA